MAGSRASAGAQRYQAFYVVHDVARLGQLLGWNLLFVVGYLAVPLVNGRGRTTVGRELAFGVVQLQLLVVTMYLGSGAGVHLFYFALAGLWALVDWRMSRATLAVRLALTLAAYLLCHFAFTPADALVPLSPRVLDVLYAASTAGVVLFAGLFSYWFRSVIQRTEADLEQANRELERLSGVDELTGIANRRAMVGALEREWARAARSGLPVTVLMCDVDHFKAYNDLNGHLQGDACLSTIARALQQVAARPADVVARYGGEEFVLVLPETDHDGALAVAEAIHQCVADLALAHDAAPAAGRVTVSIGAYAVVPQPGDDVQEALTRADRLMYAAKAAGRNRTATIEPSGRVRVIPPCDLQGRPPGRVA